MIQKSHKSAIIKGIRKVELNQWSFNLSGVMFQSVPQCILLLSLHRLQCFVDSYKQLLALWCAYPWLPFLLHLESLHQGVYFFHRHTRRKGNGKSEPGKHSTQQYHKTYHTVIKLHQESMTYIIMTIVYKHAVYQYQLIYFRCHLLVYQQNNIKCYIARVQDRQF